MADEQTDWSAIVAAAAKAQGFTIPDAYQAGVAANLARIAVIAAAFRDRPLDDTTEPAPVFIP
ncbi:MAG: DUF4089 domain-containing protein [Alphaproteobacteria bacterium]|nr:DUF4089 domain-containing protein [Alphaproteobacteria bacterium]